MNQPKVVYLGAFLTEASREKLLAAVPPRYPNVYAHHLTVAFKPTAERVAAFPFGQTVTLKVVGFAADDRAQAAVVETDLSENARPHVTVSVAEGAKPIHSNRMLEVTPVELLPEPLALEARLGASDGSRDFFTLEAPGPKPCASILIPTKPQVDTLIAVFLLKRFGQAAFPGIADAKVSIYPVGSAVPEDAVAIDCGKGEFDHHGRQPVVTATELVSSYLQVSGRPSLRKLIELARRDDIEGKGIISTDPLDRTFGLPGLLASASRENQMDPDAAISIFLPVLEAHLREEERRESQPTVFKEMLERGEAEVFSVRQGGRPIKVAVLSSDDPSMSGFLRSNRGGDHDVVAMWEPSGQLVITTHARRRPRIAKLAAVLRQAEAMLGSRAIGPDVDLEAPRRIDVAPEWYYDPGTNALLNGGAGGVGVPPTKIPRAKLRVILERGLAE